MHIAITSYRGPVKNINKHPTCGFIYIFPLKISVDKVTINADTLIPHPQEKFLSLVDGNLRSALLEPYCDLRFIKHTIYLPICFFPVSFFLSLKEKYVIFKLVNSYCQYYVNASIQYVKFTCEANLEQLSNICYLDFNSYFNS